MFINNAITALGVRQTLSETSLLIYFRHDFAVAQFGNLKLWAQRQDFLCVFDYPRTFWCWWTFEQLRVELVAHVVGCAEMVMYGGVGGFPTIIGLDGTGWEHII